MEEEIPLLGKPVISEAFPPEKANEVKFLAKSHKIIKD